MARSEPTPSTERTPSTHQRVVALEQEIKELWNYLLELVTGVDDAGWPGQPPVRVVLLGGPERRRIAKSKEKERPARVPVPRGSIVRAPLKLTPKAVRATDLGLASRVPSPELQAALAHGEAARLEWVRSGDVVPAKVLADAWGLTPQALGPAAARGEIFAVTVRNRRYYPSEFLKLERSVVAAVCQHLEGLEPSQKLVFWKRKHGSLGGRTVYEFLSHKQGAAGVKAVVELAQALTAQMHANAAQTA